MKNRNRFLVRAEAGSDYAELRINGPIDEYFDGETYSMTDTEQELLRELKVIPDDKPIHAYVNSEGGSVMLALGIHNALKSVQDRLTVHNAGYMLSSATILTPPGARLVSPKSALFMYHRPSMNVSGNEDAIKSAMDCLRANGEVMAEIYAERTGKSMKAIREIMTANGGCGTWMTGDEAIEEGFADEEEGAEPNMTAKVEPRIFASFGAVPERFRKILAVAEKRDPPKGDHNQPITSPTASLSRQGGVKPADNPPKPTTNNEGKMTKLIHALVAAGFKLPTDATEDQILPAVEALVALRGEIQSLTSDNAKLKAEADASRKARIEAHVKGKSKDLGLSAALESKWIESIIKDESATELFDALKPVAAQPQRTRGSAPPPAEPQEGTTEQKLAEVRAQMSKETDGLKLAALAKEARALRGDSDLSFASAEYTVINGKAVPVAK